MQSPPPPTAAAVTAPEPAGTAAPGPAEPETAVAEAATPGVAAAATAPSTAVPADTATPGAVATPAAQGAVAAAAPWRGRARRVVGWLGLWWVVPTALTAAAAAAASGVAQPWRDELASWSAATRTPGQIVDLGRHIDAVTVPYYLLLHVWTGWFGDAPAALRAPAGIAAAATAAAAALLGRTLFGRTAGLLAGLLVAAAPVVSRYAQEARGYTFAMLFTTVSTLLLVAALRRPRWWRWAGYAAAVLLLGCAHQVALLVLTGHAVAVAVACRRGGRMRAVWWLAAVEAAGLALWPLLRLGAGQRATQLSWLAPATPADLALLPERLFLSGAVGGAVCGLAALAVGLRRGARPDPAGPGRRRAAALLWAGVLLPVALLYAADRLVAPLFVDRYLVFAVPLLCVLAARALAALARPWAAVVVVAVVAAVGLPVQVEQRERHSGYDYAGAAALVASRALPGDGIAYGPRGGWQFTDVAFRYHLRGREPADVLVARDAVAVADLWPVECPDPRPCLAGVQRLWVVGADDPVTGRRAGTVDQLSAPVQAELALAYTPVYDGRVDGFTVALFARLPAS